jgi:nicotinamidase-related amidase
MPEADTALLVMDAQQEIIERLPAEVDTAIPLARIGEAVQAAREAAIPVIWVVIEFRAGHPEIDRRNRLLRGAAERGALLTSAPGTAVHQALRQGESDPVVTKRRTDSFAGSDLAVLLRAQRVDHLVLAGFTTSGVVLSTYLTAVDLDYGVTVLGDCCADRDPALHAALVGRLFPGRGTVLGVAQWRDRLQHSVSSTQKV